MRPENRKSTQKVEIKLVEANNLEHKQDHLAIEEPLLIQLHIPGTGIKNLSVMMRTPGMDEALAVGFCYTEGIIRGASDIDRIDIHQGVDQTVVVKLKSSAAIDLSRIERHFYTSSSCGVCGKAAIEHIHQIVPFILPAGLPKVDQGVILNMRESLLNAQADFQETGGLHATGLFDSAGQLLALCEDVGRHNAMDKLIGTYAEQFPLSQHMVMVSGRASFELVQKALMAGVPILIAIGAPSSLAVELARTYNQTLVGFLKPGRFNIYSCPERIGI